jgi:hypothetical protein
MKPIFSGQEVVRHGDQFGISENTRTGMPRLGSAGKTKRVSSTFEIV